MSREEKKEETYQRILAVTMEFLLGPDVSDFNTNEIATKAGVAKGTIFHHFGSKDKLLLTTFEEFLKLQTKEAKKIQSEDPVKALRLMTEYYLDWMANHPNTTSALVQIFANMNDENKKQALDDFLLHYLEEYEGQLVQLFELLGWGPKSSQIARIYGGMLDGLGLQEEMIRILPHGDLFSMDIGEIVDIIVDLFTKNGDSRND